MVTKKKQANDNHTGLWPAAGADGTPAVVVAAYDGDGGGDDEAKSKETPKARSGATMFGEFMFFAAAATANAATDTPKHGQCVEKRVPIQFTWQFVCVEKWKICVRCSYFVELIV